jgi:dTMP kinase
VSSASDAPAAQVGDEPAEDPAIGTATPQAWELKSGWAQRVFCNRQFLRLWLAQVMSATGDWVGLLAITAFAARLGSTNAVAVVLAARVAPGFFLGSVGGVLIDRWDRKKVMVVCDLGRAVTLAILPFVNTVWGLVVASLVLEVFTLMWSPAKEASVPNLVPDSYLTNANSLSMAAAYGSFPVAGALFAFLAKVAIWLSSFPVLHSLSLNQTATGFYFDVLTFCFSAYMISRLDLPHLTRREKRAEGERRIDWAQAYHDVREGWTFILDSPLTRAVILGLGTGLIGGAMVVPLGPFFSKQVVNAGDAGFGVLATGLGVGMPIGVGTVAMLQKRLPKPRVFAFSVAVAGVALIAAASMSSLIVATVLIGVLGACAGSVYLLGYTMLQESVSNQLRGRVFAALYTIVRMCVLLAFATGPLLVKGFDALSRDVLHGKLGIGSFSMRVPGVRMALWFAGLIVLAAWVVVWHSLRVVPAEDLAGAQGTDDTSDATDGAPAAAGDQ